MPEGTSIEHELAASNDDGLTFDFKVGTNSDGSKSHIGVYCGLNAWK